jgi:ferritin-like metal-binding protein YciE
MANSPLTDLLVDQLRDLYDAEKQLTKALPRLAKAASDDELTQGFRDHAAQTREQAQRIEQIFQSLGMKARSKPCEAMKGLVAEGEEAMSGDLDESVRDIALIAAARRVEHYEMAAYESLVAGAQAAKQKEAVGLLQETLREESATDKLLATIGKRLLKEAARPAPAAENESSARLGSSASSGSRGGSRKQTAQSKQAGKSAQAGKKKKAGNGHLSATTTDRAEIQQWAEQRGARPACVQGTGGKGDIGLLRLEFPGKPGAKDDKLTEISWDEFFEKFDERGLALVYQEQTAEGDVSNFNKLISREGESKPKSRAAR